MTNSRSEDAVLTGHHRSVECRRSSSGTKAPHDASILGHIRRLADEGLRLRLQDRNTENTERLTRVEVELYECWGLLHQRRARRESGLSAASSSRRVVNASTNS